MNKKTILIILILVIIGIFFASIIRVSAAPSVNPNLLMSVDNELSVTKSVGKTFTLDISLENGLSNQESLALIIKYNPEILVPVEEVEGTTLLVSSISSDILPDINGLGIGDIDFDDGEIIIAYDAQEEGSLNTSGNLAHIVFEVIAEGESSIKIISSRYTTGKVDTELSVATLNSVTITANAATSQMMGDIDEDNELTILDCARVLAHVNGSRVFNAEEQAVADVNGDNEIDILDCARILAHINGSRPLF